MSKTNAELAELDEEAIITTATLGQVLGFGTASSLVTAAIAEREGKEVLNQYSDWIKAGRPEGRPVDEILKGAGFTPKDPD